MAKKPFPFPPKKGAAPGKAPAKAPMPPKGMPMKGMPMMKSGGKVKKDKC